MNTKANGFIANGLFTGRSNKSQPPTYAAILAFFNVGWHGCSSDPILFINPRFDGKLPKGLLKLEQRHFDEQKNQVIQVETQYRDFNEGIGFPGFSLQFLEQN